MYLPAKQGFLGVSAQAMSQQKQEPKAVIIPFGLEATVSYGAGTSKGPSAILAASHQLELYDDELGCEAWSRYGVATLRPPKIAPSIRTALNQLESLVQDVMTRGQFPLILGGEHSLSAGAVRPFARQYPDLVVLHFDAHADLRDSYDGESFSHASAMRRVMDCPNLRVLSFGIRNISSEEMDFYKANRARLAIYWAREKSQWLSDLRRALGPLAHKPIYVSFDVDGFDASLMPATGTPEPGGLFWDEAMMILRMASELGRVVGADVNELAPIPGLHSADFVAAKLAYKILNYALADK